MGRTLEPGDVSGYWFDRGLAEIRRHPGAYRDRLAQVPRLVVARDDDAERGIH